MDTSLYQIALDTPGILSPFTVRPSSLKSLMGAMIELIPKHSDPVQLWLKFPSDSTWQTELQHYQTQLPPQSRIYSYQNHSLPSPASAGDSLQILSSLGKFKREYFLLMLAPWGCGIILAHRPRLAKSEAGVSRSGDRHSASSRRKPASLQALLSFDPVLIYRILEALKQGDKSSNSGIDWDAPFHQVQVSQTQRTEIPHLLIELLIHQIQRQEQEKAGSVPVNLSLLQQQNQTLSHALKLRDDLLKHVAQELRTPLTTMKTALSLLESPQLKLPQRQRYMQLLHSECDRQSSLITGLLELVQLEQTAVPENAPPIHLADVVPGVVSTYQAIAQEKGVQLGYTIPTGLPPVTCPESWLRQIVMNLLLNSIKFTPAEGQVLVKAKRQGDYIQLDFQDTGVGIASHELPRIFDRFYRGRLPLGDDHPGAGLGLTIVQQLLLRCGGSISVQSRLGKGSTFKVLIPIPASPEEPEHSPSASSPPDSPLLNPESLF